MPRLLKRKKLTKEKSEEDKNKKRGNSVDADQGTSKSKRPRLEYFSNSSEKYPNTSEKQEKFDHAVVNFLADTFIPFNVTGQDFFIVIYIISLVTCRIQGNMQTVPNKGERKKRLQNKITFMPF